MRLICPNCDTQYEVDDNVIPDEGRDVQCSSCGKTWFQKSAAQMEADGETPAADPEPETTAEDTTEAPQTAPAQAEEPAGELEAPEGTGESVLDILRQEAALETAARKQDAENISKPAADAGLDLSQSLDDELPKAAQTADEHPPVSQPDNGSTATKAEHLPDIDKINSTLRADPGTIDTTDEDDTPEPKGKRGFRLGFSMILILATAGLLAYIYAPEIVQKYPESEPYMALYVEQVNNLRDWLDQIMKLAIDKMSEFSNS